MNTTNDNTKNGNTNKTFKAACLGACEKIANQLERTKNNFVNEFRGRFTAHEQLLTHAINQADALAWQTGYPHLFFPVLATERIQAVASWQARQQRMRPAPAYALAA